MAIAQSVFPVSRDLLEKYRVAQINNGLLPVRVSDFYLKKIRNEIENLGHAN